MLKLPGLTDIRIFPGSGFNRMFTARSGDLPVLIKVADTEDQKRALAGEHAGLAAIAESHTLRVPTVCWSDENHLVMEWIESGQPSAPFWQQFGHQLARLHGHTHSTFGFSAPTSCGPISQDNTPCPHWSAFFLHQRLEPEFRYCRDAGLFSLADALLFERFSAWFLASDRFPVEPPALLHGDLWKGNWICSVKEDAVVIDPAVYYGHREIDLGMSLLFGGFAPGFYSAYQELWPLESGWKDRIPLSQLYHLLIHVRLFGGSYGSQVMSILRRLAG